MPGAASGVAVGAVVAPKRHLQTVIKALDERQWRKKRTKVHEYDCEHLAVAVAPEGARALDAFGSDAESLVPAPLAALLRDGAVRWATGHRHVSAAAAPSPAAAAAAAASPAPPPRFRYAELFAGVGGFRLALDGLGGRCVFASEIDPCAAATYERNFGDAPLGDITEVPDEDLPAHDLLTAGFPCQSFSRSGEQRGLGDARGDLFFEIVRVASRCRPAALGELSRNLLGTPSRNLHTKSTASGARNRTTAQ